MWKYIAVFLTICAGSAVASADYNKISDRSEFIKLVSGKTLTRPLIKLQVSTTGKITGRGASWDVNGAWTWKNGFFCRDLNWGGTDLGYNCQEVGLSNGKLRFTSDQGRGQSAEFRLR